MTMIVGSKRFKWSATLESLRGCPPVTEIGFGSFRSCEKLTLDTVLPFWPLGATICDDPDRDRLSNAPLSPFDDCTGMKFPSRLNMGRDTNCREQMAWLTIMARPYRRRDFLMAVKRGQAELNAGRGAELEPILNLVARLPSDVMREHVLPFVVGVAGTAWDARVLVDIGISQREEGRFAAAKKSIGKSLEIYAKGNTCYDYYDDGHGLAFLEMGALLDDDHEHYNKALAHFEQGLVSMGDDEDRFVVDVRHNIARALAKLGLYREALEEAELAFKLTKSDVWEPLEYTDYTEYTDKIWLASVVREDMARWSKKMGGGSEKRTLELALESDNLKGDARCYDTYPETGLRDGRMEVWIETTKLVADSYADLGDWVRAVECYADYGRALLRTGKATEAAEQLEKAVEGYEKLGAVYLDEMTSAAQDLDSAFGAIQAELDAK